MVGTKAMRCPSRDAWARTARISAMVEMVFTRAKAIKAGRVGQSRLAPSGAVPGDSRVVYRLGTVHPHIGKPAEARRYVESFLAQLP